MDLRERHWIWHPALKCQTFLTAFSHWTRIVHLQKSRPISLPFKGEQGRGVHSETMLKSALEKKTNKGINKVQDSYDVQQISKAI